MKIPINSKIMWRIIAIIEFFAILTTIWLDLFLPTLVIIGLMIVSLLIRREHISLMGFKRPQSWLRMVGFVFVAAFLMQLFDAGVIMPVLNRLTGTTIDYSSFAKLQGNTEQLLGFLAFSWTLAAVGEELAYRGYLQKTLGSLLGKSMTGVWLTTVIASILFGLAHVEQGLIGVVITTGDALFFSWLKIKYDNNLWAPILAHGFYNTIGILAFYFMGPIYGLW